MYITLQKNDHTVTYKADYALYLLLAYIPIIGWLILIFMTLTRHHFKGIVLNQIVLYLISLTITTVLYLNNLPSLLNLWNIISFGLFVYIYITYALKANQFAVKQRLHEGYKITSPINHQTKLFLDQLGATPKPLWQLINF